MNITIDDDAGFCFGVSRAIETVEELLKTNSELYVIGSLVHNEEQMQALQEKGLKVVSVKDFKNLKEKNVVIRAHGEPPATYSLADDYNIKIQDLTCPIVLKLQKKISKVKETDNESLIVIFGKSDHPEVIGLVGSAGENAIVVASEEDFLNIDFTKTIHLFSQTTMDIDKYEFIQEQISEKCKQHNNDRLIVHKSMCGSVSQRVKKLREKVVNYDTIVFVSGKNSSNGNYLFKVCKEINKNTIFVSSETELDKSMFLSSTDVLVTGATSTPKWLINKVCVKIKEFHI